MKFTNLKFGQINILILFLSLAMNSEAAKMSLGEGTIKFTAVGKPGFLKILGDSKNVGPKGNVTLESDQVQGEFSFLLSSLDTGIKMRNDHMKEKYLEISKFPDAKLVLKPLKVSAQDLKGNLNRPFEGTLTLHGVTKDVSGQLSLNASSKKIMAQFEIKVSDFNIDVPKYLGITVSETVKIAVETTLVSN